jgi:hypothetical protein
MRRDSPYGKLHPCSGYVDNWICGWRSKDERCQDDNEYNEIRSTGFGGFFDDGLLVIWNPIAWAGGRFWDGEGGGGAEQIA